MASLFFQGHMGEEKNIRMVLEYEGSGYHGWQRQKGVPTIQGIIEDRIQVITGEPVSLHSSGRTDAGVHALNQVCNFRTRTHIDPKLIQRGLNSLLPNDIFIKSAEWAPTDFHSRYSAKGKTYEYRLLNRPQPDVFLRSYVWHIKKELDLERMAESVSLLTGEHDFSSFKSSGSGNVNPVREIFSAQLLSFEKGLLSFVFEANGFLRHMVRNIVGTVVEVGLEKIDCKDFIQIFHSRDRRKAGPKAPPQGLFLTMVHYE